jgi:hypothetical protein
MASSKEKASGLILAEYGHKVSDRTPAFNIVVQVKSIAANVLSLLGTGAVVDHVAAAFWSQLFPGAVGVGSPNVSTVLLYFRPGATPVDNYKIGKSSFVLTSSTHVTDAPGDAKFPGVASPLSAVVFKVMESFLGAVADAPSLSTGQSDPTTSELKFVLNGALQKVVAPEPTSLLFYYLQTPQVNLLGTKAGCHQGGFVCNF